MRPFIALALLTLLIPGRAPAGTADCLAEAAAKLAPASRLVIVCRNGTWFPARLIAVDTAAHVLSVTRTSPPDAEARSIPCRELREIRYRKAGRVQPGFMFLGLALGAAVGAGIGGAVHESSSSGFSPDLGGAPAGAAIGAGVGLVLGAVVSAILPSTRHIRIQE